MLKQTAMVLVTLISALLVGLLVGSASIEAQGAFSTPVPRVTPLPPATAGVPRIAPTVAPRAAPRVADVSAPAVLNPGDSIQVACNGLLTLAQASADNWTLVCVARLYPPLTVVPPTVTRPTGTPFGGTPTRTRTSTSVVPPPETVTRTPTLTPTLVAPPLPPHPVTGIWLSQEEIQALPMTGAAWSNVKANADKSAGTPDLANQDDGTNVLILAKALVYARTGEAQYRDGVLSALRSIENMGTYNGRALALGRELAAYVISADLIGYRESAFVAKVKELRDTPTDDGPVNLIECHEKRANNWGLYCGASRVAVDRYIGDTADLARAARVFQGWLGDRSAYAGFSWGDLDWQANPAMPVGINPTGSTIQGFNVDGVLPDDLRRGGGFHVPPSGTGYVWGALSGATIQAELLHRAGYPAWLWGDRALGRSLEWLDWVDKTYGGWWADGDDQPIPWLVNHAYGAAFRAASPASSGKGIGWTDWTHANH